MHFQCAEAQNPGKKIENGKEIIFVKEAAFILSESFFIALATQKKPKHLKTASC